ncbi:transketolase [Faecalibaculum rodentium]|uniref:transketolase n=1 Tax=Faecalibaculum rodentium TaxID=1702221 RepID=UPI0023F4254A|nr:transketolase [Faecalibaculum rodentium]
MENMNMHLLDSHSRQARRNIVEMVAAAGSGHPGGSLSCTDILTWLYDSRIDLKRPDRDRLVLSKGHAAPALYAQLAVHDRINRDEMLTLRRLGSPLQGHPNMEDLPDVDMSTGSLGQGLSAAVGMAWADRYKGSERRIWCVCGDGELEEGQIWEAAMAAGKFSLGNLTLFVDLNGLQIAGAVSEIGGDNQYGKALQAFGWQVLEIDGHDFEQIEQAVLEAEADSRPTAILCHTVKGKGVSFMENQAGWHGKAPNAMQLQEALIQLEETGK